MNITFCDLAEQKNYPFVLPNLPYDKKAFGTDISAECFDFHHGKHHNSYVVNLNKLLENSQMKDVSLEQMIIKTVGNEEYRLIYNNSAQIWNHSFFWHCMSPDSSKPVNQLLKDIDEQLGGIEKFKADFKAACLTQFGSGWGWLVRDRGVLKIMKTSNADCPIDAGRFPLLTCDVWEHAYYIDYRNDRAKFIDVFLEKLLNWDFVNRNYKNSLQYT